MQSQITGWVLFFVQFVVVMGGALFIVRGVMMKFPGLWWRKWVASLVLAMVAYHLVGNGWGLYTGAPRHVVRRLGQTVVADYWTTNRYEVVSVPRWSVGTNGLWEVGRQLKTNAMW
jgi:hypothetical protein